MTISTTYRDNEQTQCREAWQNGKLVYRWTRQEIEVMRRESADTVWAWGHIPHWRRAMFSNAALRGAEGVPLESTVRTQEAE